jgi:serpin B
MNLRLASLPVFLAAACTGGGPDQPPEIRSDLPRDRDPQISAEDFETQMAASSSFAADLYREARGEPGNLFMSPYSITTALAMTYAGAAGNTAVEMAATLHFDLPPEQLHRALNKLDLELESREAEASGDTIPFRLRTANALFAQAGYPFQARFLDTLAVNYGAGVRVQDFQADPDGARETINRWVEGETNDRIRDLLAPGTITTVTRLVLTNAIYFTAAWDDPFDAADTRDVAFQTPTGPVTVPTLHGFKEGTWGEGPRFRAAELPYDGGKLGMVIVLPDLLPDEVGDPLALLEAELTGDKLAEIDASLHEAQIELALPKFQYDAPLSLRRTLESLGMVDAFANADFSGIDGTTNLVITDVIHKGFVAIDERGTEAAAATAVIVGDTSVPEQRQLIVDRPFLFLIRDRPTGAILFIGRVVDPS